MEYESTLNMPEVMDSIIQDCEEILVQESFRYESIDKEHIRVFGFSPQIISQVMRNHLPYTSPLISVALEFVSDEHDTIISIRK